MNYRAYQQVGYLKLIYQTVVVLKNGVTVNTAKTTKAHNLTCFPMR